MTGPAPGTAPGDLAVYAGRHLRGYIRWRRGGVHAFDAEGRPIGQFPNRDAAFRAVKGHGQKQEGAT